MARGLPDYPPDGIEFKSSLDDETCPDCGWDREEAAADIQGAWTAGVLLAIEIAEQSPFSTMGTTLAGYYWRCKDCQTHFTTEDEDSFQGAMS